MNVSPLLVEWIKKGIRYQVDLPHIFHLPIPLVVPAGQYSNEMIAQYGKGDEGILMRASLYGDSPYLGISLKTSNPLADSHFRFTPLNLWMAGFNVPNNWAWCPRYQTVIVVPIYGVLTISSVIVAEEWYFKDDLKVRIFNLDPLLPHNVYAGGATVAKKVSK